MMRLRHVPARRALGAFALVLFLTGTNFCLVSHVASRLGAHVSCMAPAPVAEGSCHSAAGASHCPHAASPARSAPARGATPPCCVALAPVLATAIVKIPVEALAPALAVSAEAETTAPVVAPWCGYRVTRDAGPPALHPRAPLAARAPPLA